MRKWQKKHGKLVSYFSTNTLGHTYYGIDKRHCKRVSPLTRRCQVCIYYIYINQSIAAQVQYMWFGMIWKTKKWPWCRDSQIGYPEILANLVSFNIQFLGLGGLQFENNQNAQGTELQLMVPWSLKSNFPKTVTICKGYEARVKHTRNR